MTCTGSPNSGLKQLIYLPHSRWQLGYKGHFLFSRTPIQPIERAQKMERAALLEMFPDKRTTFGDTLRFSLSIQLERGLTVPFACKLHAPVTNLQCHHR